MPASANADGGAVCNRRQENARNARPATDLLFLLLMTSC
jgi:hypothetical protein